MQYLLRKGDVRERSHRSHWHKICSRLPEAMDPSSHAGGSCQDHKQAESQNTEAPEHGLLGGTTRAGAAGVRPRCVRR